MTASRMESLLAMRERKPDDTRVLFALATEYEKLSQWSDVVDVLREYLATTDDQGNAWGRLAKALIELGQIEEAKSALVNGTAAANKHGHPSMAALFEGEIAELDS